MDLSKAPPISQKRTLAFINHFIINTVSFLNKFMISCESKLQKFDQRMQKLEASLCILEAKLSSIPGLDVEVSSVQNCEPQKSTPAQQPEIPEVERKTSTNSTESENLNATEETVPKEENPLLVKYLKMIHVGVPVPAVKMKMKQEGVDPDLLNQQ